MIVRDTIPIRFAAPPPRLGVVMYFSCATFMSPYMQFKALCSLVFFARTNSVPLRSLLHSAAQVIGKKIWGLTFPLRRYVKKQTFFFLASWCENYTHESEKHRGRNEDTIYSIKDAPLAGEAAMGQFCLFKNV